MVCKVFSLVLVVIHCNLQSMYTYWKVTVSVFDISV